MHSIIRDGQFHGQLHGQFKAQLGQPQSSRRAARLPSAMRSHALSGTMSESPLLSSGQAWQRRQLVRPGPATGRIDVCRLILATLGLALYLALPVAAVSFAYNLFFG
ncbi:MAG: hypothetical protein AB8G23_18070 [Myxococcota bacterium]